MRRPSRRLVHGGVSRPAPQPAERGVGACAVPAAGRSPTGGRDQRRAGDDRGVGTCAVPAASWSSMAGCRDRRSSPMSARRVHAPAGRRPLADGGPGGRRRRRERRRGTTPAGRRPVRRRRAAGLGACTHPAGIEPAASRGPRRLAKPKPVRVQGDRRRPPTEDRQARGGRACASPGSSRTAGGPTRRCAAATGRW